VFGDPFEVACQHPDCLDNLGPFSGVQRANHLRRCFLQFVQQLDRQTGEIVDEIERVLDLVRDAGGQLPERSHLLCMDQTCLRRLQLAQCLLGRVPRKANGFLSALALRDVGVDQHKAATGHGISAHFDDATVGAGALEAHFAAGVFDGAAQLRFEISRILAALGKIAEIIGEAWPLGEEGVGVIEEEGAELGMAQRDSLLQHGIENRPQVFGRTCDDTQHLGGRGLPVVCLFQLAGESGYLLLQIGNG